MAAALPGKNGRRAATGGIRRASIHRTDDETGSTILPYGKEEPL